MLEPTPTLRLPGAGATRNHTVVHGGLAYTVATDPECSATLYDQTRGALAQLDEHLAEIGLDKSRLLQVIVYITDMEQKPEMNRAWDEWVDRENAPQRACLGAGLEEGDLIEVVATAAA